VFARFAARDLGTSAAVSDWRVGLALREVYR